MIDLLICSALYKQNLSGYGIKSYIDNNYGILFKSSAGSIHPILKKMIKIFYINETVSFTEGGQKKIIYSFTKEGKNFLLDRLLEDFSDNPQNSANEFIARLICINVVEVEYRSKVIKKLEQYLEYEKLKIKNIIENNNANQNNKILLKILLLKQRELNEKSNLLNTINNQLN